MKTVACCVFSIAILASSAVLGDTPPASKNDDVVTLQLGKVSVTGRQEVLRALQAIKVGLHTPISGSKKDRDKIVCRIHNALGSHVQQILTCAPNWKLATIRMSWQTAMMGGQASVSSAPAVIQAQELLESITSGQQDNMFNLGVTPNFQTLLDKLPDVPPPAATLSSPAKRN
jgi:hypothetical protein